MKTVFTDKRTGNKLLTKSKIIPVNKSDTVVINSCYYYVLSKFYNFDEELLEVVLDDDLSFKERE